MIIDGFVHQLPDIDPAETQEWLDSLDAVVGSHGTARARFLLARLLERARELQVGAPGDRCRTPYVNTIPADEEPWFPGDEDVERRIRAFIRWNAAVMVVKANKDADGIGGHLSTFASSAALYDVGFNHFFRGKDDGLAGDHVYIQGHAAPGHLRPGLPRGPPRRGPARPLPPGDRRRRPVAATPTRGSCPTSGSTRRCRWASARSTRSTRPASTATCTTAASTTPASHGCGASSATASATSPRRSGSISLAAREQLDNLIWVVNCNLQRLDGPVRGNGKIIQELEAIFRGAGWNVIKVIWGSKWDELLARDVDGVLLEKMNTTVDGEFQRYTVEDGAYIREHFFGPDPRLRKLVEHLTDDDLRHLPRGGHDYRKLYAAYKAATEQRGAPTVILAKTVKGWTLGPDVEGRNATHQIKKMTNGAAARAPRPAAPARRDPRGGAGGRRRAAVLPAGRGLPRAPVPDDAAPGARRPAARGASPRPSGR